MGKKALKTREPANAADPVIIDFDRIPLNDDELWWTVYVITGFKIPRHNSGHPACQELRDADGKVTRPAHSAPFEAFADAFFARHTLSVWKGSRGLGGKSRTLAVLSLVETILFGTEVRLLGGSGAQSQNLLDATRQAWASPKAPLHLLGKEGSGALATRTLLTNGGDMSCLNASENQVRGPHPPRLRMDEIDVMKWSILESALGMPMDQTNQRGEMIMQQTVMSSTHQNANGPMTKMLERAEESQHEEHEVDRIAVFEWCFRETSTPEWMCQQDPSPHFHCGWLTEDAIRRKKALVSEAMWRNEFEMQEPSIEGRAIDVAKVADAFDQFVEYEFKSVPLDADGLPNRINRVFESMDVTVCEPRQGRSYITGIDWGRAVDMTVIAVFDVTDPNRWICVRWIAYNGSEDGADWVKIAEDAVEVWRPYGGPLIHDFQGVGSGQHAILKRLLTPKEFALVEGFKVTGANKKQIYSEYVVGIEGGQVIYPRITYAYDSHRFATEHDLFEPGGHPPDAVCAGALAWTRHAKAAAPRKVTFSGAGNRGASPWRGL